MTANPEITIPKARNEVIFQFILTSVVIFFFILGIVNLFNRIAIIASGIWLSLVIIMIWTECRDEGGLRAFLINRLGTLVGRQFAESSPSNAKPEKIRFGYELLGHRFIQRCITLSKIESVEWNPGQASDMAGHDMNDWNVCLWFDHDNPAKSQKLQKWHRKQDQDVYIVGPSRRKESTAAFGLEFVSFLRQIGASLEQGENDCAFIRNMKEKIETDNDPTSAD